MTKTDKKTMRRERSADVIQKIPAWVERRADPIALALGACLALLAWTNRFVQDDAFISFRYARNLAEGLGLSWNPGELVEGYSNFLWTLIVAGGIRLGAEPVAFTQGLGLVLFALSLYATWRLAVESGMGAVASLAALLVTGANFTFSSYATGGLETPLVTVLFLTGLLITVREMSGTLPRDSALWSLSIVWTAGVLTRMDTAILLAVPVAAAFIAAGRTDGRSGEGAPPRSIVADLLRLGLVPAVAVGGWLAWKLSYYGNILPRSFYLKALNTGSLERGLRYFYDFIVSYDLGPFFFFCLFCFGALFRRGNRVQLLMAATVAVWFAYILKMGGDFMEYRFLVPALPPMMLLLLWALTEFAPRRWIAVAGVVLLVAGSFRHAASFSYDRETGVEPVAMLEGHLEAPNENWVGVGKALHDAFDPSDGVIVATTAAGAIPYYSRLKSVDMLGLTEPTAERLGVRAGELFGGPAGEGIAGGGAGGGMSGGAFPEGVLVSNIPGHQRMWTYEYLERRGVHLVLSHPILTRDGDPPPPLPLLPKSGPPRQAKLVMMPVGGGYRVLMLYIRRHPAVDAAIVRGGWEVRDILY